MFPRDAAYLGPQSWLDVGRDDLAPLLSTTVVDGNLFLLWAVVLRVIDGEAIIWMEA
jgi:hypothetical protein